MRSTVALALSALSLFAAPALAEAGCLDALRAGTAEVQRAHSISDAGLTAIGAACHGEPAAALVNELVRVGQCDSAAQLGRSLAVGAGASLDAAVAAADQCLADRVAERLDDLSAALEEAESMDEAALGGLGSMGAGYGGGGILGRGRSAGPVGAPASRPTADASSRWGGDAEARGAQAQSAPRASTGAGRYVASPLSKGDGDDRLAIADGAPVAWSRLDLGIWFDYDSAALRPEALATLATLSARLQSMRPGTVLEIVGHTDSRGSWDYNLDLSARRAESVRSTLLLAGAQSSTMGTRAMGESDPIHSNRSWQGRAQNRRVEFRFLQPVARRLTR